MRALRVLAVSAATGRVAYAFFVGDKLCDWRVSEKAAKSPKLAAKMAQRWITEFRPDVVVTEAISGDCTKGAHTQQIIEATNRTAADNYLLDVAVKQKRRFDSKYQEAEALAECFPETASWVPKRRRTFDKEPRNIVLFEAIALAVEVLREKSTTIAASMG